MNDTARSPVIAGLGMTEMGKVFGRSAAQFAGDAVRAAASDAGIALSEIDGLLISGRDGNGVHLDLQRDLSLQDLKMLTVMQSFGSTAGVMVQMASMAIRAGAAEVVACVWADAPLSLGGSASNYADLARVPAGWSGLRGASGARSCQGLGMSGASAQANPLRAMNLGPTPNKRGCRD